MKVNDSVKTLSLFIGQVLNASSGSPILCLPNSQGGIILSISQIANQDLVRLTYI